MGVRPSHAAAAAERRAPTQQAPLDVLEARLAAIDAADAPTGDCWAAHAAILDRLETNRRAAQAAGWTSLALERDGGRGRFRLVGIPPGGTLRREVEDRGPDDHA